MRREITLGGVKYQVGVQFSPFSAPRLHVNRALTPVQLNSFDEQHMHDRMVEAIHYHLQYPK